MRRTKQHAGIIGFVVVLLMSCTFSERAPDTITAPITLHDALTARLAEVQGAQTAALTLWDRLIFAEEISCQEAIPQPQPVTLTTAELNAHPDAALVRDALNAASQAVRNSSDLWNIECNEPRDTVPLSMAHDGRATALLATESLSEAAALLAAWE
jgi:hypothetical protein